MLTAFLIDAGSVQGDMWCSRFITVYIISPSYENPCRLSRRKEDVTSERGNDERSPEILPYRLDNGFISELMRLDVAAGYRGGLPGRSAFVSGSY